MLLLPLVFLAAGHTYTHRVGFIGKGGDVIPPRENVTLEEAEKVCSATPQCHGVTFKANSAKPAGKIPKVYFKQHEDVIPDPTWHTYIRDYVPPPPMLQNPCLNVSGVQAGRPWCNYSLPIAQRVADMISRMSVKEKISQLGTSSPGVPSLDLVKYDWWSEASHGVASGEHGVRDEATTNFAFPITTGMAFNRSLWYATGRAIGIEARAAMNAGKAFSTFWAPVINLAREPRWGRNIETPGEDPYLSGEFAVAYVRGMQEDPDDPTHILASACCKHYVANSMEGSTVDHTSYTRHTFSADITMQDLVDSYMLPFQMCVEQGRVTGLMCSYNAVNGVPSCANDWLLKDVARGEWGFDGYITSDCGADNDVFANHHFTKTPEESVAAILKAGTDVDCGDFVGRYAQRALDAGVITTTDLDERLRFLFTMRMRLGHFDPPTPMHHLPESAICTPATQETAADGAAQGSALLKNDHATLPLAPSQTVAVIGPNALLSRSDASYYGPGNVCDAKYWTLVDGVAAHAKAAPLTASGVPSVTSNNTSGIAAAVAMSQSVERVILAVGTDLTWGREGMDANPVHGLSLSPAQAQLVHDVAHAAKAPVTVVLMTANPLDISSILTNPKVGAVLHVGQPSVAVRGVGDVLYGIKPPAGRLIQTIYPASYATSVSIFDFNMRPGPSAWPAPGCTLTPPSTCPNGTNPGRTYRFYTGQAVRPFGYGLSYTTFTYGLHAAPPVGSGHAISLAPVRDLLARTAAEERTFVSSHHAAATPPLVRYAVNVTNTGKVASDDVVLGFLTPPGAGKGGVPLKQLFGFERVHVEPGETVTVWLYPAATDLTSVDELGVRRVVPGEYTVEFGVPETATEGMGYVRHTFNAA